MICKFYVRGGQNMTVKELMSTNVYFISSDAPVTSAAALMKKKISVLFRYATAKAVYWA